MSVNKVRGLALGVAIAVVGVLGAMPGGAQAQVAHPRIVSEIPSTVTPHLAATATIDHPAAYALESANGMMYVGGQFEAVQNSARTSTLSRKNFVAFNATTGVISSLAPTFDGPVNAIRYFAGSLYVAGEFTTVSGVTGHRGIVKINATTGAVDNAFRQPWGSGKGMDLQVVGGRIIVSGTFAGALLALNPATGANTGFLNLGVSGTCVSNPACGTGSAPPTNQPTQVYRFAVSGNGTRLVAIGNFVSPHPRAFMVDMTTGTLANWYYQPLANTCALPKVYPAYLRDVDFAPDGSYFVIASTGFVPVSGGIGRDVCDAAARFETSIPNPVRPTWINYTGGDSLHSVAVTGAAVYVNGHQRWLDNAAGRDRCAPGCVSRPGIGAINPVTGKAMSWNPGKTRGVGGKDLYATTAGLWVASDGAKFNGKYHLGIAFVPVS